MIVRNFIVYWLTVGRKKNRVGKEIFYNSLNVNITHAILLHCDEAITLYDF